MKRVEAFCKFNGFELTGKICISYNQNKWLTLEILKKQLYSHYKKSEVVILFDVYGGIVKGQYSYEKGYRLYVKEDTDCDRWHYYNSPSSLHPSKLILSDAAKYIKENLNGTHSYISVMLRMERILLRARSMKEPPSTTAHKCLKNALLALKILMWRTGVKSVFFSLDVGTYGSNTIPTNSTANRIIQRQVEEFMSAVYGRTSTLAEYDESFSIFSVMSSGYIALVQKTVAAMGEILVLIGSKSGSSFQISTKSLYRRYHTKHQIFELSKTCSI